MEQRRFLRIGHKGAAALAPENTIGSLAAALEVGVDMVEFDVVDAPDGTLVLAHSHEEIQADAATLDEALAFLASEAPASLQLDLDLKWHGFEASVVGRAPAARPGRALDRLLVLPGKPARAATVRARTANGNLVSAGQAGIGATAGALSGDPGRARRCCVRRFRIASGGWSRRRRQARPCSTSRCSRARRVERCHALGVSVFAWTVDDEELLARVVATGVDGVITNDPRIFDASGESP